MTGTPLSLAETPDRQPRAGPDLLSEMLKGVRLSGSVFLHASFTAPFGIVSPNYFDRAPPQPPPRHVSILHLSVEGSCTSKTTDGNRREVHAGELLFLPFADRHKFWSGT